MGLKTGNIDRVAASLGLSGTLKKKREEIVAVSYGGKKTPRSSSYSQGRSRPSQNSYQACYTQDSHPNNPPIYQNTASTYSNVQAPLYQSPPPNYQNPSPIYPNHPPPYQIPSPYQGVAPNCANMHSSYRAPPLVFQVQAPPYQNPHLNYQARMPNYQTNSYPRNQAPCSNNRGYQQMPPPQGTYDPPQPQFEKKPSRNFSALAKIQTKLYERLAAVGYIHPVGPKPVDINSKFYRPDQRCAYHSNTVEHDTEDCRFRI
ncbi:extensin-2-like [Solanum pennellii]|uniref:Extensin-2-like n=1 Tax=Solanum pennellii TaxID=28526 RepID=A0ABM1GL37_SOLPN|nr:extensin-2-like [Solanum pennellii]